MRNPVPFVILVAALLASSRAVASEADPFYSWLHPPRDGTTVVDGAFNAAIAAELLDVNHGSGAATHSCRDVGERIMRSLYFTAFWYPVGQARRWGADVSPSSRGEWGDRYRKESVYRYAPLIVMGSLVPLDPAVSLAGVHVGTDKIGHFITRGLYYYDRYLERRARGMSEEEAERDVVIVGFREEKGWLGYGTNGVLSFADLEANWQGFKMFRELCENPATGLVLKGGKWVLQEPFSIARWVTPCWDEGFNPSTVIPDIREPMRRAITELCPRLSQGAPVQRRLAYAARGCGDSLSRRVLRELVAAGEIGDPTLLSVDTVCGPAVGPNAAGPR